MENRRGNATTTAPGANTAGNGEPTGLISRLTQLLAKRKQSHARADAHFKYGKP